MGRPLSEKDTPTGEERIEVGCRTKRAQVKFQIFRIKQI
jgi:hypothetical protein